MLSNDIIKKITNTVSSAYGAEAFFNRAAVAGADFEGDWEKAIKKEVEFAESVYKDNIFGIVSLTYTRLHNIYGASIRSFVNHL